MLCSKQVLMAIAAGIMVLAAPAMAQQYPTRPVKIIVPYPPGGGTDVMSRVVAKQLTSNLGQQFIVDNHGGADATLGAALAAKAANDGYTLLAVAGIPFVLNQFVYTKISYHILNDFEAVSLFASGPLVLISHPSLPAETAKDLIAHLKANPGKLNYAGSDQSTYLGMEMIKLATGTDMVHIAYKGVGPSLVDLLGGHVSLMLSSMAPALPYIQAKKVKALAVTSKKRSPALPNVPTIAETIVPDYEVVPWYGMFVPKGTPNAIVSTLNAAINRAVDSPEVKDRLGSLGTDVVKSSPEQFAQYLRVEFDKWGKIVKATNLPTE